MQARQVAALQLPPEDWADELAGINGQLIESLEELAAREDEITTLTDELSSTKAVLRDVHAKETLLYREHIAQQKAFDKARRLKAVQNVSINAEDAVRLTEHEENMRAQKLKREAKKAKAAEFRARAEAAAAITCTSVRSLPILSHGGARCRRRRGGVGSAAAAAR